MIKETAYTPVAIGLHWLMAFLIIGLWIVGSIMGDLEPTPLKFQLYGLHKATGILILMLAIARLLWRFTHTPPPPDATIPRWQRLAASVVHYALYGIFFAMPVSGWLMSSAAGFPVSVYGLFIMPDLVLPNKENMEFFEEIHEVLANLLLFLVAIHTAAALAHHYYFKDATLRKMLPFLKNRTPLVLLCCSFAVVCVPASAQQTNPITKWRIDQVHSKIVFTATQNNAPINGTFTGFDGSISFDPENLAESKVDISIPLNNVEITYDLVKQQLLSGEWFDTLRYPTTTYTASRFEKQADGSFHAFGVLTLRGVTHPVTLSFTLPEYSPTAARMEGKATLSRSAFGIGQGAWAKTDVVADRVDLVIVVTAQPH
jgi:cytochrome b561/polyisoprenoid-binding protein YceI